jgi:hypothetical protein
MDHNQLPSFSSVAAHAAWPGTSSANPPFDAMISVRPGKMIRLTRPAARRMLPSMRMRSTHLSVLVAVLAALAMIVAAPIHAAHNHGNDLGHPNCAVCQLHSPACGPIWQPCAGIPLEPLFVLASTVSPTPVAAPTVVDACRAPPFFVA